MSTVKELVTERLGTIGSTVREKVVAQLVETEVQKRTEAVVFVVKRLDESNEQLKKINRGDLVTYNEDGSVASTGWSKGRVDEIKKIKESIQKLENALELAFEKNDFQKIMEFTSK